MIGIISLEEIIMRTQHVYRKNNFNIESLDGVISKMLNVFEGIIREHNDYGFNLIITSSNFDNKLRKKHIKKDYIDGDIVKKEVEEEFELIDDTVQIEEDKLIVIKQELRKELEKLNNACFIDEVDFIDSTETLYFTYLHLSSKLTNEKFILYSSDERIYQLYPEVEIETSNKVFNKLSNIEEVWVRMVLSGLPNLGINNVIPNYSFKGIKYGIQFGDKTIGKILSSLRKINKYDNDTILEVLNQFSVDKFISKISKIATEEEINSEKHILELISKVNLNSNIKALELKHLPDSCFSSYRQFIESSLKGFKPNKRLFIRFNPKV